jgi:hypothetical protein
LLFNYETHYENNLTELVFNDVNRTMTKQEKTILQIEKFIMKLNYNFFQKSCITDHHFRHKRSLVDNVLNDLVDRRLLHQAHDDKSFFGTKLVSTISTYLKFLSSTNDELFGMASKWFLVIHMNEIYSNQ